MGFLKELNKELPYGSAMSLLGIYPGLKTEKIDTYLSVFTEALFTIAKKLKKKVKLLSRV